MSIINTSTEYYKVQPRSSSERDNSHLLQSALKEASNDMAHRLLNYASLDKMDCEASCILIALANHQENQTTALKQVEEDIIDNCPTNIIFYRKNKTARIQ